MDDIQKLFFILNDHLEYHKNLLPQPVIMFPFLPISQSNM